VPGFDGQHFDQLALYDTLNVQWRCSIRVAEVTDDLEVSYELVLMRLETLY
jgi:hypothetical protein